MINKNFIFLLLPFSIQKKVKKKEKNVNTVSKREKKKGKIFCPLVSGSV